MGSNLATLSLGGVGGYYPWLLHNSGIDLATGFQVSLGGGTDTPLYLDEDGIGVRNASGFVGSIRFSGAADGTVTLRKDQPEAIVLANQSNTTTTGAAVPDFALSLEVDKRYRISGWIICQHNNAARGVQLALTGPSASLDLMHVQFSHLQSNAMTNSAAVIIKRMVDFADYYTATTCPLADVPFLTYVEGVIHTNGVAPASSIGLEFKSSAATHAAQILAGSRLTLEEY